MSNLFSIFEVVSWFSLNLLWIDSVVIILLAFPPYFWLMKSQSAGVMGMLMKMVFGEFKSISSPFSFSSFLIFPLSFFILIFLVNFFGLFPYIFTSSAFPVFGLSLALPYWLGYILWSLKSDLNFVSSHLVPMGTPNILIPFMVIIEMISNMIRPMTLSIRLTANMIAGHLILCLLALNLNSISFFYLLMAMIMLTLLCLLELGVSGIQAYVFSALTSLYLNEFQSIKVV